MRFSLQNKIYLIFTVVIIVPMILVAIVFNSLTKDTLIHQIRDADLKTMETIDNSIENILVKTEQHGIMIANDKDLNAFFKDALLLAANDKSEYLHVDSRPLLTKFSNDSTLNYISLLSNDGYLIGEHRLEKDRLNYVLNTHLFSGLSKDNVNWQRMYTIEDVTTKETYRIFPCIIPVNDLDNGDNLGYVVVYLDERELHKSYAAYNERIYILNDEQRIISHQDVSYLQKDHYHATKIGYSYLLKNQSTVIDNKVVLTTQELSKFGWQMVIITSFKEYTPKGIYSTTYFIIAVVLVLLFAIAMGFVISKYITNPILKLKNAMQTVDKGNLSVRYDYKSNDEIGQLGKKFNDMLDTIQNLMKKVLKEDRLKQTYKLQLIQAQVNPHFLYNALEMINSLIRLDFKEKALEATSSISKFYRISLSDGVTIITIEEEVDLINNYLFVQKMRYIEFIEFNVDIDPKISKYLIPKLTLQPIVENSIYHGLKEQLTKGLLNIRGYLKDDKIIFEIEDNGKGISEAKLKELSDPSNKDTNFGINCIKDRLMLYFGDDISYIMESKVNEYSKTTLIIPCKTKSGDNSNV